MKKALLFLAVAFVFVTTIVSCTTDDTALENEKTAKAKLQGETYAIEKSNIKTPPR